MADLERVFDKLKPAVTRSWLGPAHASGLCLPRAGWLGRHGSATGLLPTAALFVYLRGELRCGFKRCKARAGLLLPALGVDESPTSMASCNVSL